mgnify:CR=1 FL=1
MDTVQKAAQMAQRKGAEDQEKEEKARVENELKNRLDFSKLIILKFRQRMIY